MLLFLFWNFNSLLINKQNTIFFLKFYIPKINFWNIFYLYSILNFIYIEFICRNFFYFYYILILCKLFFSSYFLCMLLLHFYIIVYSLHLYYIIYPPLTSTPSCILLGFIIWTQFYNMLIFTHSYLSVFNTMYIWV
jgi:hypothetical protein